jgi:molybdopterin/thiamine biosynthesis adenylyltransferase
MASTFDLIDAKREIEGDLRDPKVWSYEEAFSRNRGLFSYEEQERLRTSRVAIAGMGGVGGVHLITLARLGIGKFTIADPDVFELANFNRQYGATTSTLGRNKAEVMAELALDINPDLDIRVIPAGISESNIAQFLKDADVFVDGLDFFAMRARRLAFRIARSQNIWSITAGPHAFGASWLLFSPDGLSFDEYFDLDQGCDDVDELAAFAIGVVPALLHLKYLDLSVYFQPAAKKAASVVAACNLASAVVATEVARILVEREGAVAAPGFAQFDIYRNKLKRGRLLFGNRHPVQRLRRWRLAQHIRQAQSQGRSKAAAERHEESQYGS